MKTNFTIFSAENKPLFIDKETNVNIQKGDCVLINDKIYTCISVIFDIDRGTRTLYIATDKYIHEHNL